MAKKVFTEEEARERKNARMIPILKINIKQHLKREMNLLKKFKPNKKILML